MTLLFLFFQLLSIYDINQISLKKYWDEQEQKMHKALSLSWNQKRPSRERINSLNSTVVDTNEIVEEDEK